MASPEEWVSRAEDLYRGVVRDRLRFRRAFAEERDAKEYAKLIRRDGAKAKVESVTWGPGEPTTFLVWVGEGAPRDDANFMMRLGRVAGSDMAATGSSGVLVVAAVAVVIVAAARAAARFHD